MCAIMGYTGTDIPMEKLLEGFGRTKSRGPDDSRVLTVPGGTLMFHRLAIMGPEPTGMPVSYTHLSTQEVDLSHFAGFQKLQDLDLYGCTLLHSETLTHLPSLRLLNLGETGVNDLSFLTEMPAMTDVDLRNNPLTDLTPLLDCPWLTLLTLSPRHQPLVQEQLTQAPFQIQYQ